MQMAGQLHRWKWAARSMTVLALLKTVEEGDDHGAGAASSHG